MSSPNVSWAGRLSRRPTGSTRRPSICCGGCACATAKAGWVRRNFPLYLYWSLAGVPDRWANSPKLSKFAPRPCVASSRASCVSPELLYKRSALFACRARAGQAHQTMDVLLARRNEDKKNEADDRGTRLGWEYFRTNKGEIGGSGKYWKE